MAPIDCSRMHATDSLALRKARGAFFTPPDVAAFVTRWAVRSAEDRAFEPSCGEAAFLLAASDRLRDLGAAGPMSGQLSGVELHAASADAARQCLAERGVSVDVRAGDFFEQELASGFDAVVGNPPFVRYQDFAGDARLKAREAALKAGVRLSGLASSWAAFVVASAALVRPGGRLGLVLPAELLSVNYAGPVRRFLMDRFRSVKLAVFEERVFPGVLEEVVLLLAEGVGPTTEIEVGQTGNLDGLDMLEFVPWEPTDREGKWTPALLSADALDTYEALQREAAFVCLETWGRTNLGMVTGNNRYFALTTREAHDLKLSNSDLTPISPPGSAHLRGLTLTTAAWQELADAQKRVLLFRPSGEPSEAAERYIRRGKRRKVHAAYKCRVRDPWWRVPNVPVPDLFVTYMNHDTPRLVANEAGVGYVNSVHGVRLKTDLRDLGKDLLPVAALNSLTMLGAEVVGRSYGGGVLKLEPKEADQLPVPAPEALSKVESQLRAVVPHLSKRLRSSDLAEAVDMVDRVLLIEGLGLGRKSIRAMRDAREQLFSRRVARAGAP